MAKIGGDEFGRYVLPQPRNHRLAGGNRIGKGLVVALLRDDDLFFGRRPRLPDLLFNGDSELVQADLFARRYENGELQNGIFRFGEIDLVPDDDRLLFGD